MNYDLNQHIELANRLIRKLERILGDAVSQPYGAAGINAGTYIDLENSAL